MVPAEKLVYTVAEVAELLRCNPKTVYRMVSAGDIHHVRVGNAIRIPAFAVEALLEDGSSPHPEREA